MFKIFNKSKVKPTPIQNIMAVDDNYRQEFVSVLRPELKISQKVWYIDEDYTTKIKTIKEDIVKGYEYKFTIDSTGNIQCDAKPLFKNYWNENVFTSLQDAEKFLKELQSVSTK